MELAVKAFLDWLAKRLPPILAAFGFGYKLGQRGEAQAQFDLIKKELELEREKNKNKVLSENYDKSADDILRDAISEGQRIIESKRN